MLNWPQPNVFIGSLSNAYGNVFVLCWVTVEKVNKKILAFKLLFCFIFGFPYRLVLSLSFDISSGNSSEWSPICIGNSTVSRGIWDKYRDWCFTIHQDITRSRRDVNYINYVIAEGEKIWNIFRFLILYKISIFEPYIEVCDWFI